MERMYKIVTVNNFVNINKTDLSPKIIEHEKTAIYDDDNSGPG
jgi:hypothetical protein